MIDSKRKKEIARQANEFRETLDVSMPFYETHPEQFDKLKSSYLTKLDSDEETEFFYAIFMFRTEKRAKKVRKILDGIDELMNEFDDEDFEKPIAKA